MFKHGGGGAGAPPLPPVPPPTFAPFMMKLTPFPLIFAPPSGVAKGGGPGPRAQALEGAPAQLQRRSQVSLAGGGALTEFQGGGDKPPYKLPLNFTQIKKCQGSSLGGLKFFQGGGDPRYATGPTPTSNVLDALHEVPINIYQLLTVFC